MEQTSIACFLLCIVGFLKEVRPSEFFVTEYLIGWKNVTVEEVFNFGINCFFLVEEVITYELCFRCIKLYFQYGPIPILLSWLSSFWSQISSCTNLSLYLRGSALLGHGASCYGAKVSQQCR